MPDPCAPRGIGVLPGRVLSERRTVRCKRSSLRRKLGVRTAPSAVATLVASAAESPGFMDDTLDQPTRVDAVGHGGKVEHQAVIQGWNRDVVDVVVGDVDPSVEQSANLGAEQ